MIICLLIITISFDIKRRRMDSNESQPVPTNNTEEPKKDKGVSKATAQKLLAKYKALQVIIIVY